MWNPELVIEELEKKLKDALKSSQTWMEAFHEQAALVKKMEADRNQWKANHDDIVKRNAVLRDRPDLPVDRLPALARLQQHYDYKVSVIEGEKNNEILELKKENEILSHRIKELETDIMEFIEKADSTIEEIKSNLKQVPKNETVEAFRSFEE